jgi:hypothetical protein
VLPNRAAASAAEEAKQKAETKKAQKQAKQLNKKRGQKLDIDFGVQGAHASARVQAVHILWRRRAALINVARSETGVVPDWS